jgi:hypothetical protein
MDAGKQNAASPKTYYVVKQEVSVLGRLFKNLLLPKMKKLLTVSSRVPGKLKTNDCKFVVDNTPVGAFSL